MVFIKKTYLRSPAKINLFLRVIKKMSNSYHEIQSLVSHINLYDEISIHETNSRKTIVKFRGAFAKFTSDKNNSILSTITLLKKLCKNIRYKNFVVTVKKNIPVGSGLGGGTSNAVTIFQYLIKKFDLKIDKKNINKVYQLIGADSKIFNNSNSKFVSGNGDIIQDCKSKIKLNLLLIFPNQPNFTRNVYHNNKKFSKKLNINYLKKIINKNIFSIFDFANNDLIDAAIKLNPAINKLMTYLQSQNICDFIQMSGSGSCCFAVFKSKKILLKCQKLVKTKYRSYWTAVAKTIT
jgi:4-diphosphocytidyl-2-C-methyl-D-erythritol kinase